MKIKEEEMAITHGPDVYHNVNDENKLKVIKIHKEQAYTAQKCMNIIEKVISDKNNYF